MSDNVPQNPMRFIDAELLELGPEVRAQLLDEFLNERLHDYQQKLVERTGSARIGHHEAERFGILLAEAIREFLNAERSNNIETNWNVPEDEETVCRRAIELGRTYSLSPENERRQAVKEHLDSFSHLPLPLEEMMFEDRSIKANVWGDTPIEERRKWVKVGKDKRDLRLNIDTHCGVKGPRIDPRRSYK